jgi:AmiR/NasT family two-component response regulator
VNVSKQDLLTDSQFARLYARTRSMPVIEQAKGVLMYQQHCDEDEAFDLLRRASQRSNVPVRVLAERIVQNVQRQARRSPA